MHEITPTFRRVLVALADQPLNYHSVAEGTTLSISTAKRHLREGLEKGYFRNIKGIYSLTDKGTEAILLAPVSSASGIPSYSRAKPASRNSSHYDVYKPAPYNHNDFRPGSMDAYKLPSLTLNGRVWP